MYAPRFELSHFFRSALLLELREAYIKLKRELKDATPAARISRLSGLKKRVTKNEADVYTDKRLIFQNLL
jgi:hypothetical protein